MTAALLPCPNHPVHLYVHIPFCHHICPYCAFYKHQPGKLANAAFVEAVLAEARSQAPLVTGPLRTIYFGGGTPSLLSGGLLKRLCLGLADCFDTSGVEEWTIEANPATFTEKKAGIMLEVGINRVSLGVQSFQTATLETLGRDHTGADAVEAYELLRRAGFSNISIDLMFSIPRQNRADWQADLDQVIALEPEHVSAYNLTYEEDTDFLRRHQAGELDTDVERDAGLFYQAMEVLEAAGWGHYEISNYARPGFESKHNQAYWTGADYLGLGPSAVSTWKGRRWKTLPDTASYIRAMQDGVTTSVEWETLSDEDRRIEAIALRLRTREGVPEAWLEDEAAQVEVLVEQGLLRREAGRVLLTKEGKALADPVAAALI